MSDRELRKRAEELAQVYWHHSMRLLPDLTMRGAKTVEELEAERAAILGLVDLSGRTVVDVGSWNGYFAFEAKRAGACRVIATDSYAWREELFRGRETFDLARECLGIDVEAREIDPTEFPGDLPPVDVVLFLGVFYHLIDPIMVLQKLAALAVDLLVIETHQDLVTLNRPAMVFYPGKELGGDGSNWWGPNPECLTDLLGAVGFPYVVYQKHPTIHCRGIYHAFRSAETAGRYLCRPADNVTLFDLGSEAGRCAIFCRSSEREVELVRVALKVAEAERDSSEREVGLVRAALKAAEAERDALLTSTTWRMTAPLRYIIGKIKTALGR